MSQNVTTAIFIANGNNFDSKTRHCSDISKTLNWKNGALRWVPLDWNAIATRRGVRDLKIIYRVHFRCRRKIEQICWFIYISWELFFSFLFSTFYIEPMRIFSEMTTHNEIFLFIDVFNTYILTRAWNTKLSHISLNFVLKPSEIDFPSKIDPIYIFQIPEPSCNWLHSWPLVCGKHRGFPQSHIRTCQCCHRSGNRPSKQLYTR